MAQLAGQGVTHKAAVAHAGAVNAVGVDVIRCAQAVDQVGEKSHVVHRRQASEHIPKAIAQIVDRAVGVYDQEIGRVGYGAEVAVELLLCGKGGITMQVQHQGHRGAAVVHRGDVQAVVAGEAATLDRAGHRGLGGEPGQGEEAEDEGGGAHVV